MKKLIAAVALLAAFEVRADSFRLKSWALGAPAPAGMEEPSTPSPHNDYKLATATILLSTVVVIIAWDVFLASKSATTESQMITHVAWRYSSIPFAMGILVGHWLFTHYLSTPGAIWPVLAATTGAVLAWDLLRGNDRSWTRYPGIWFAVGVPIGAFFWGQKYNPNDH